jgi:hypothetical protein
MSIRTRAALGTAIFAVGASLAFTPAAGATVANAQQDVSAAVTVSGSANSAGRAGVQQWSKWYTVTVNTGIEIRKTKCRSYVSINTGSKLKLRAYVECNRRTHMNVVATGTYDRHPIRSRQRACMSASCEAVTWVNNRKGVQRWCVSTWPIINGDYAQAYRNRPTACINY